MSLLAVIPKSVPAAKRALSALDAELGAATTYTEIRKIERFADALRLLFREVEEVRHQAEDVIVMANHRIGTEIAAAPVAKGGQPKKNRHPEGAGSAASLKEQVGSKNRGLKLKKLAAVPKAEVKAAITKLHEDGKDATVAGVLKLVADEDRAETRKQSRSARMAALPDGCTVKDLSTLVSDGRRFGAIYADPPWLYDNQATRAATTTTRKSYDGMSVADLCALPIGELALPDAHLHLWTTNAFLFECPRIFAAWGFEFKSSFVWVKPTIGTGNYWRNSHEILLTAVRGDATRFNDHTLRSWIECDRGQHSAKPEQVRGFIERASDGPYLELFGRRSAPGWIVWGNQIERTIFDAAVKEIAA